eukprot:COSAG02_NODE_840_length_16627_cov_11.279828_5_plen_282_part_00
MSRALDVQGARATATPGQPAAVCPRPSPPLVTLTDARVPPAQLDPSVRQEPWSKQEDAKLISSQAKYGGRWSKISRSLPGRSEAAARQRWAILSQTKMSNSGLPLELGKGKRERSPAISPPPPAPRPPTFYQELASPAIRGNLHAHRHTCQARSLWRSASARSFRAPCVCASLWLMGCFCAVVGESHGGTTPLAPGLDVLASPSKRRRNLVLRAGSDGLLLPDDVTSAVQQEQEGTAPPAPAGAVAGKPGDKGKEAVQPYTVRFACSPERSQHRRRPALQY